VRSCRRRDRMSGGLLGLCELKERGGEKNGEGRAAHGGFLGETVGLRR